MSSVRPPGGCVIQQRGRKDRFTKVKRSSIQPPGADVIQQRSSIQPPGADVIQQRGREDCVNTVRIGPFLFAVVFDGHGALGVARPGGDRLSDDHVAKIAQREYHQYLARRLTGIPLTLPPQVVAAIIDATVEFDRQLHARGAQAGSTMTAVLIDPINGWIYQINLGDSRSLLIKNGRLVAATVDHDPISERERIVAAGGFVMEGRVSGVLAVARAFGDFDLKRNKEGEIDSAEGRVCAVPTVTYRALSEVDEILLVSDAPFEGNRYNNEMLVQLLQEFDGPSTPTQVAKAMATIISQQVTDDTTVVYIRC